MKTMDGWASGLLGVAIFSGSLPATRIAVGDFSPLFLTSARAVIAGVLAGVMLSAMKSPKPSRADFASLVIVALGVVIGFPLLTALALQQVSSAHSIVFIGLLPLMTAIFGVLRAGERPGAAFWFFSLLGSAIVVGFAAVEGTGGWAQGDLLMLAAIAVCGLGYAEGAQLSRRLGGWQVISWALVISLLPMGLLVLAVLPAHWPQLASPSWLGLAYVSVFSMLVGFIFWYRGLARGGIASVGQLQLLQPFFGFLLAASLLGETVSFAMLASAMAVIACVFFARRFAR